MSQTKSELRRTLKQARLAMSPAEHAKKSHIILTKLRSVIDWSSVETVHCFEPIAEQSEVNIDGFLSGMFSIYTSRRSENSAEPSWSIVSLGNNDPIPENFDVVIVPMLGFDASLQRIGYGGGYYDKLLSTQPGAKKIGVCFEQGKVDQLPVEPHDIPLDMIITEKSIHTR